MVAARRTFRTTRTQSTTSHSWSRRACPSTLPASSSRGSSLGLEKASLLYLGHVQVPQLEGAVLGQEEVSALNVSVHNLHVVQGLNSSYNLNKVLPHLFLRQVLASLFVADDLVVQVSTVGKLHDDTERAGLIVKESFLVCDDVHVVDGSQNSDLVDGLLLLFFT